MRRRFLVVLDASLLDQRNLIADLAADDRLPPKTEIFLSVLQQINLHYFSLYSVSKKLNIFTLAGILL